MEVEVEVDKWTSGEVEKCNIGSERILIDTPEPVHEIIQQQQ